MKYLLAALLACSLCASAAFAQTKATIVTDSQLCRGTLGSAQWINRHAFVFPMKGVNMSMTEEDKIGNQRIVLTDQYTHRTATITVNAGRHILAVKHRIMHGDVICALPD